MISTLGGPATTRSSTRDTIPAPIPRSSHDLGSLWSGSMSAVDISWKSLGMLKISQDAQVSQIVPMNPD